MVEDPYFITVRDSPRLGVGGIHCEQARFFHGLNGGNDGKTGIQEAARLPGQQLERESIFVRTPPRPRRRLEFSHRIDALGLQRLTIKFGLAGSRAEVSVSEGEKRLVGS